MAGLSASDKHGPRIWPEYRDDPVGFFSNVLGSTPWRSHREERLTRAPADVRAALEQYPPCGQVEMLEALADPDVEHVVVCGAKGFGKTWSIGRAPLWWHHTRDMSVVVVVSTTGAQVQLQVFGEMEKALIRATYQLGRLIRSPVPLYQTAPGHYVVGLSPAKPEALQGWHAQAAAEGLLGGPVLVVVDEVSGITDPILDATFGLLTNPGSKMIWTTNAKRASGRAYEMMNPLADLFPDAERIDEREDDKGADEEEAEKAGRTVKLRICAYDAPPHIIGERWLRGAEARPAKRGSTRLADSQFRYDVLGFYPTSGSSQLFPRAFLEKIADTRPSKGGLHMGVDLGRTGDRCIATLVENGIPVALYRWAGAADPTSLMQSAHIIRQLARGDQWQDPFAEDKGWDVEPGNIHLDATGLGWGVVDRLWEMGLGVDGVNFGPTDWKKPGAAAHRAYWSHVLGAAYPKLSTGRADLYFLARRCMEEGLAAIPRVAALAPLWEEALAIEGGLQGDTFWIQPKDDFVEAHGYSPDYMDSYVTTFSRRDAAAGRISLVEAGALLREPLPGARPSRAAQLRSIRRSGRRRG